MASGISKRDHRPNGCDVLLEEASVAEAIVATDAHYDLLPGNGDLTAAELKLMDALAREHRLKEQLAKVTGDYDTILIDCPPSLNLLTLNALTAADGVLIPVQCEYFALEGLSSLLETIKAVRQRLNPALEVEGLLRTMYDVRNNLGNEVSAQLTQHFGDKVLRSIIPRNVRLAEAPSHGQPIHLYDRSSRGAIAYVGLAGEMIRRERNQAAAGAAADTGTHDHEHPATRDAVAGIHQE
jgi:chromosome partitioning protein